ncbi:unnamed protein product [Ostreobium quekettii]|uniref:Regulator of chromosome condensation 1/beta-lactamase-inhibitor protein II n=1 Tax=Ostreobium quekettii TaxID=121088 RepID=A0A8S1ITJ0_9CHLO|nr:unnamed protein product [Ostreobium quekettii]
MTSSECSAQQIQCPDLLKAPSRPHVQIYSKYRLQRERKPAAAMGIVARAWSKANTPHKMDFGTRDQLPVDVAKPTWDSQEAQGPSSDREHHLHAEPDRNCTVPVQHGVQGGTLFTCGVKESRLGRDGDNRILMPAFEDLPVVSVAGSGHTVLATADGRVYTLGRNDSRGGGGYGTPPIADAGQLGRGGGNERGLVAGPLEDRRVVQVAAGRYHSVALTDDGDVFTWGLNDWGQLGREGVKATDNGYGASCTWGAGCRSGMPGRVSAGLEGVPMATIAAGRYWTMAASMDGRLWTWGLDGCATHGDVPSQEEAYLPREVGGQLAGEKVVGIDAGYVFWAVVTSCGEVFTCDTQDDGYASTLPRSRPANEDGELGREGNPKVPGKVTGGLKDRTVLDVAAGRAHGLAVTSSGDLFSWGKPGPIIGRDSGSRREPDLVKGELEGKKIVSAAAGEYFSLAATADTVYGFGHNGYATLSMAQESSQVGAPKAVEGPLSSSQWAIQQVQAGYQHSLVIATRTDGGADESSSQEAPSPDAEVTEQPTMPPLKSNSDQVNRPTASSTNGTEHGSASISSIPPVGVGDFDVLNDTSFKKLWGSAEDFDGITSLEPVGVSKCGTTDLYWRILGHPDVSGASNKGPHFWDECRWPPVGNCTVPPDGAFQGYVHLFDNAAKAIENET